jgi:hypothetical protein
MVSPSMIFLALAWFLPESPAWLMDKGNTFKYIKYHYQYLQEGKKRPEALLCGSGESKTRRPEALLCGSGEPKTRRPEALLGSSGEL